MPEPTRRKIAILGGGPAGLSAAWNLTSQPGWQDRYEVTIYQLGWRVGGKGATGRNPEKAWRIEEHGIHVYGNFYPNTLHMVHQALGEVQWTPQDPKFLQSMETAFRPSNYNLILDFHDGKWSGWAQWAPGNREKPWETGTIAGPEALVGEVLGLAYGILSGNDPGPDDDGGQPAPHTLWERIRHAVEELAESAAEEVVVKPLAWALKWARDNPQLPSQAAHSEVLKLLGQLLTWVGKRLGPAVENTGRWRQIYTQLDLLVTLLKGVIADDIITRGVDVVDGEDFRQWLTRHGVTDWVLNTSLTQSIANICFQYANGDTTVPARMSAAAWLTFALRQLLAPGFPFYFFASSTGESIIQPLYRVLVQRGVKIEWFHKVREVVPAADGASIAAVEIDVQARTRDGKPYQPLVMMPESDPPGEPGGLVWPSHPLWDQLEGGQAMVTIDGKEHPVDFESWWNQPPPVARKTLKAGMDFDTAVLAIPIGCFEYVCPRILEQKPAWRRAVEALPTIPTMQVQLWLDRTTQELGWRAPMGGTDRVVGATYTQPFADFGDFTELIALERWPASKRPKSLLYLCGPIPDMPPPPPPAMAGGPSAYPKAFKEHMKGMTDQFLRNIYGLLPNASSNPIDRNMLDFNRLVVFDEKLRIPAQRLDQQYLRVNIDPNERYVLSLPNSAKARLKAWDSGYENLVLCGDWIYTGINMGCFEGAVMSGRLASYAITGTPKLADIWGYDFLHRPEEYADTRPGR